MRETVFPAEMDPETQMINLDEYPEHRGNEQDETKGEVTTFYNTFNRSAAKPLS